MTQVICGSTIFSYILIICSSYDFLIKPVFSALKISYGQFLYFRSNEKKGDFKNTLCVFISAKAIEMKEIPTCCALVQTEETKGNIGWRSLKG